MAKYSSKKKRVSRLQEQEAGQLMKQTYLYIGLTIVIILAVIFIGIPALIKLAVFIGDIRDTSTPIGNQDTIPPAIPQLNTPPPATHSATINIAGFAESGAIVELYHANALESETVASQDGSFAFDRVKLDTGANRFHVVAIDQAGNESPSSKPISVNYDDQPPDLELTGPANGSLFYGPSEQTVTVTGTTGPDASVSINGFHAVVDPNGSFSARYQLKQGDNTITVVAVDQAGNRTQQNLTVRYEP